LRNSAEFFRFARLDRELHLVRIGVADPSCDATPSHLNLVESSLGLFGSRPELRRR
jgi:hypothetical protein